MKSKVLHQWMQGHSKHYISKNWKLKKVITMQSELVSHSRYCSFINGLEQHFDMTINQDCNAFRELGELNGFNNFQSLKANLNNNEHAR